jgi:hypothetical protein
MFGRRRRAEDEPPGIPEDVDESQFGWVYITQTGRYLSLLRPAIGFSLGLPSEALVAELRPEAGEPATLLPGDVRVNAVFVAFFHEVLSRYAPTLPEVVAEARRQVVGWVYLIDARSPTPQGEVPPEDIIGCVEVRGGEVVPGSYVGSPSHQVVSERGLFRLPPSLHAALLFETERVIAEEEDRRAEALVASFIDDVRRAVMVGDPTSLLEGRRRHNRQHGTLDSPEGTWQFWMHGIGCMYSTPNGTFVDFDFHPGADHRLRPMFDVGFIELYAKRNGRTQCPFGSLRGACERRVSDGALAVFDDFPRSFVLVDSEAPARS